jgi:pseudouridine synthase
MHDPEGRRTVSDIIRAQGIAQRVVPVGRLDYDTAGVLLLTDDGDLAHILTHPRFGVEKTYRAIVAGRLAGTDVAALAAGVALDDGRAAGALVRVVATRRLQSTVDITIHEGRNRQVRRMFEQLGHPVIELIRLRFGPIGLGTLGPGSVRVAAEREVRDLRSIAMAAS